MEAGECHPFLENMNGRWPCGSMVEASTYGAEDRSFEACRGQLMRRGTGPPSVRWHGVHGRLEAKALVSVCAQDHLTAAIGRMAAKRLAARPTTSHAMSASASSMASQARGWAELQRFCCVLPW